jgi:carotenoid cleavage dioxygenase-like enzyme
MQQQAMTEGPGQSGADTDGMRRAISQGRGELPRELNGTLFRNGPIRSSRRRHRFVGDGMPRPISGNGPPAAATATALEMAGR